MVAEKANYPQPRQETSHFYLCSVRNQLIRAAYLRFNQSQPEFMLLFTREHLELSRDSLAKWHESRTIRDN